MFELQQHNGLPAEIEWGPVEGSGGRYLLPRRELGNLRWIAVPVIAIAVFVFGFMTFWAWGFAGGFQHAFGNWGLLAALVALPGYVAGGALLMIAGAILFGRAELSYREDRLTCCERVGIFRWQRHVPIDQIQRLTIAGAIDHSTEDEERVPLDLKGQTALLAEMTQGKDRLLIVGYPRALLRPLADHLARALHVDAPDLMEPLEVREKDVSWLSEAPSDAARAERPAATSIELQASHAGKTFIVPAPGVWKGSGGLFGFSLFWCGFMAVFTSIAVGILAFGDQKPEKEALLIFGVMIPLFWAIGIGMLLGAINMGRRQAAIAVINSELRVIQSSLFGVKRREWLLSDIQTVRSGRSGVEVNNQPVMQLQIVPKTERPFAMLTGRTLDELNWIARELREMLPHDSET